MPFELLPAQTGAGNSKPFGCFGKSRLPVHFLAPGLTGSETVTLQVSADKGETFIDYYVDGVLQQITAINIGVAVYAPGVYRGVKSATTTAVPIVVSTEDNP